MTVLRVNVLIVENVNVAARRQKVLIQSGSSPLLHDLGIKETGHPDRFHLYTSEVKKEKQMFYLYSYLTFSVLLRKDLLGESVVVSVQLPVIGFVSLLTCPYTYD